jgi:hypothetical protein
VSFLTGSGASLQFGKESTFGTGVTPSALVDITSESLKLSVEKSDEGSLLASKTPQARDLMGISAGGSVSFILRPEFAGLLVHAALGGADTAAQVGSTGKYTHTMNLCGANADLPSLTLVVNRKAAVKQYPGCTISSLSLDCAAGDYVKGGIEVKGVKEETGTLAAGLTGFTIPSYRCTSAVFTIGGTTFDISSASFKVDNAIEDAPKTYASGLYPGQPQHGQRSVTISFEIPYSASVDALKGTYLTTEANASVVLTFGSSNTDCTFEITIPNLAINDIDASVGGTGLISATVAGEALSVGNDEPVTIVITDKTSAEYGE